MPSPPRSARLDAVLLRRACPHDAAELIRLAELDSAAPLDGPALVAEVEGVIVAALCQSTARAVADPFAPSSLHLVDLLRRRSVRRPALATPRGRLLPRLALGSGWAASDSKRW